MVLVRDTTLASHGAVEVVGASTVEVGWAASGHSLVASEVASLLASRLHHGNASSSGTLGCFVPGDTHTAGVTGKCKGRTSITLQHTFWGTGNDTVSLAKSQFNLL